MQIVSQSQRIQLECLGKAVWQVLNTLAEWWHDFFPAECVSKLPSSLSLQSRDESIMLFFPSYYNAFKEFSRNVPIMLKKVPIMPVCHGKKVYHWRWWAARLGAILHASRVWQSSVQCRLPHGSCAPARRVSRDLTLSHKVRRPRQACWIMKRLKRRVLGRAPGNPLAHFWSCRQYYY